MSRARAEFLVQLNFSMDRSRLAVGRHSRKCFLLGKEGPAEGNSHEALIKAASNPFQVHVIPPRIRT
jgi:hypothetical protein